MTPLRIAPIALLGLLLSALLPASDAAAQNSCPVTATRVTDLDYGRVGQETGTVTKTRSSSMIAKFVAQVPLRDKSEYYYGGHLYMDLEPSYDGLQSEGSQPNPLAFQMKVALRKGEDDPQNATQKCSGTKICKVYSGELPYQQDAGTSCWKLYVYVYGSVEVTNQATGVYSSPLDFTVRLSG